MEELERKVNKLIALGANKVFQDRQENRKKYFIETCENKLSTIRLKLKLLNSPIRKTDLKKPVSIKPLLFSPPFNRFFKFFSNRFDVLLDKQAIFRPYPEEQVHQQNPKNISSAKKNQYWRTKTLEQYKSSKKWKFKKLSLNCSFSQKPLKLLLRSVSSSPAKSYYKPGLFTSNSQNTTYASLNHKKHNRKLTSKSLRSSIRPKLN